MERNYNENAEQLLATASMGSLIRQYALPGAVGLVFFSLQGIVDGIIVGNFIGPDALAGASLVIPIITLLTAVALIVGIGSQAQMSIGIGQGDYDKTKSALKTGLLSVLGFAVLFTIVISLFSGQVVKILGAEDALYPYSVDYIRGLIPFAVPLVSFYFFDYVLKSLGHPRFSMIVMVGSVAANAALSVCFITQFELGIAGVAMATGLTMLIGSLMSGAVVLYQIRHNRNLNIRRGHFSWRLLGRILYNGSSEGVSEIAMGLTLFLFNVTLMKYAGKDGVAAFSVINYMIFIGTSILLGMSDGTVPIISFNFGAGLNIRIRETLKIVIRTALVIGILFLCLLWIGGEAIISLFFDESGQPVTDLAISGAKIVGLAFLLNGFNIFTSSFFTAIDNAKISVIIASMRGLAFPFIGILILPQFLGITGIWLSVPFAEGMTAIVSFVLLRRKLRYLR